MGYRLGKNKVVENKEVKRKCPMGFN